MSSWMVRQCPENSIIRWKWFVQEHTTRGIHKVTKYSWVFTLGLTLGPCEELQDSVISWMVPYKKFSADLTNSCLVCARHFQHEQTTVFGRPSFWSKKVKTVWWAACCLPFCLGFYLLIGSSEWPGHLVKQKGSGRLAYMGITMGTWGVH